MPSNLTRRFGHLSTSKDLMMLTALISFLKVLTLRKTHHESFTQRFLVTETKSFLWEEDMNPISESTTLVFPDSMQIYFTKMTLLY